MNFFFRVLLRWLRNWRCDRGQGNDFIKGSIRKSVVEFLQYTSRVKSLILLVRRSNDDPPLISGDSIALLLA